MRGAVSVPWRAPRVPGAVRWASRIEAWPPALWLALQVAAAWPVLWWGGQRMADGSDEPLGLVALAFLAVAAACGRLRLQGHARPGWLAAALACSVGMALGVGALPMLLCGVAAALGLACTWAAYRAPGAAVSPVLGLLCLALPVIASLQFYAGYPLRLVTAHCSAWLLQAVGVAAEPSGASLAVAGRLVIVDAPCSGVQMAWLAYCAACATALWRGLGDKAFLQRLPLVGLTVLGGNVLRNSVLVARESGVLAWPAWTHEAIGLVALAAACAVAVALMQREVRHAHR